MIEGLCRKSGGVGFGDKRRQFTGYGDDMSFRACLRVKAKLIRHAESRATSYSAVDVCHEQDRHVHAVATPKVGSTMDRVAAGGYQ